MEIFVAKDNRQSGPYSREQILAGLADKTFEATDLAWREGMASWEPLSSLLRAENPSTSPASPPPMPAPVHPETSGLAITSLVCGIAIVLFGPISGLVAVITGHMARSRIKASLGRLTGAGIALAGLILGYLSLCMLPILLMMIAIAVPNFIRARDRSIATNTLEDLMILNSAVDQYSIENKKNPGDPVSEEDLKPYLKPGTRLYNTFSDYYGHHYGPFRVNELQKVNPETFNALSDVADPIFWSPYK